jgi:hypothetical protein
MARPTTFKLKKGDKWVEYDDYMDSLREPPPKPELVQVDLSSLPNKVDLDPRAPLEHLMFEAKSIRPYVHLEIVRDEDGNVVSKQLQIRSGIPPEFRAVAQDILRKYAGVGKPPRPKRRKTAKRKSTKRKSTRRT